MLRRELKHIISSMQVLDRSVTCALSFVVKEVEEKEAVHLNYYSARQEMWTAWKNLHTRVAVYWLFGCYR